MDTAKDLEMSLMIHIAECIVLFTLTLHPADSSPVLTVRPDHVDLTNKSDVFVTCTFKKKNPARDTVYSVLISRRHTTIAVCFEDHPCSVMVDNVSVENSSVSNMTTLQLRVRQVTCEDRGEYSCEVAVRQSYRNVQLTSNVVRLNVTGKPGKTYFNHATVIGGIKTHTKLHFSCTTLQSCRVAGWTWRVTNFTSTGDSGSCVYSEKDCLDRCSSELKLDVPIGQDKVDVGCSIAGTTARSVFNISRILLEQADVSDKSDTDTPPVKMNFSFSPEKRHITNHLWIFSVSLLVLAVLTVLSVIRLSKKRKMCMLIFVKNKQYGKRISQSEDFIHLDEELDGSNIQLNENHTLLSDHKGKGKTEHWDPI